MLQPGAQQLHRCMFEGACIYSKVSMCTVTSSLLLVSQGSRCQGAQQLHQWARGCGILLPVWPGMAGLGRHEWEGSACLDGIIYECDTVVIVRGHRGVHNFTPASASPPPLRAGFCPPIHSAVPMPARTSTSASLTRGGLSLVAGRPVTPPAPATAVYASTLQGGTRE